MLCALMLWVSYGIMQRSKEGTAGGRGSYAAGRKIRVALIRIIGCMASGRLSRRSRVGVVFRHGLQ
jgi:hypothetical protein